MSELLSRIINTEDNSNLYVYTWAIFNFETFLEVIHEDVCLKTINKDGFGS